MPLLFFLLLAISVSPPLLADEPIRLVEKSAVGTEYRVVSDTTIKGELLTPVAKDKPAERVTISGTSTIDYAEKVLTLEGKEADFKTVRAYDKIDFRKTTGDRTDRISLRPAIRRIVMMKKGHAKGPFSPDGPLTWGEIDMLRTDTLIPALAGLLPEKPVKPGDSWKASAVAVAELTDIEKVEKGELTVKFEQIIQAGPRKVAQLAFSGALTGVNEDGPTEQRIAARMLVDIASECISFVQINGEHLLLDGEGKQVGKITGTYQMQRSVKAGHRALSEAALQGLNLTPGEENTRLLYDSEETGVRFVHSRNWRVVRTQGRQIAIDEKSGAGLLITLDPPGTTPTPAQYLPEVLKELKGRNATLEGRSGPDRVADGLDFFSIRAIIEKEKVTMAYYVARQDKGGATFAAQIPDKDREDRMKELDRLARSFTVTRRLDGK